MPFVTTTKDAKSFRKELAKTTINTFCRHQQQDSNY